VANHKSAEKRNRQAQVRRLRNKMNKSRMKNCINKVNEAIASGSSDDAQESLRTAVSVIAKTASKGTIHRRNASRNISRLTKRVNAMGSSA